MASTEDDVAPDDADDKEMSDEDEDSEAGDEVDDAVRERIKSVLGDAAAHSDVEVF